MWRAVQNNIGKFQNLFGNQFIVVDNSDGANYEGGIMSAYRKIGQWTKTPPNNHVAQRWIRDQKQRRNIKEDIKKMDMGDVIKDFYKSDAPQFKGKSKKKRREMASPQNFRVRKKNSLSPQKI